MKQCAHCKVSKDAIKFTSDRQKKDGLSSYCKSCCSEKNRNKYLANSAPVRRNKKRNGISTKSHRDYSRLWRSENRESVSESDKRWRKSHPEKAKAKSAEAYAALSHSKVPLLNAGYRAELEGYYQFCSIFPEFEVDHIVPIRGKQACGLHVPWNLQVLPSQVNRKKSNLFNPDVYPQQGVCAFLEL